MKTILAFIIMAAGFEVQAASLYMCRSYNTGSIIVADMNARTVAFKDRFGNELNLLDNVAAEYKTLESDPTVQEILLSRNEEMVMAIFEQGSYVRAETKEDDSFLCFSVN